MWCIDIAFVYLKWASAIWCCKGDSFILNQSVTFISGILQLAERQNYLVKPQFPDYKMWKEKIITKKGSKITEKGSERYDSEFPDRDTSYLIGTVFLTAKLMPGVGSI